MQLRQCLCALPSAPTPHAFLGHIPYLLHSDVAVGPKELFLHPLPVPGRHPVTSTLPAITKDAHGHWMSWEARKQTFPIHLSAQGMVISVSWKSEAT